MQLPRKVPWKARDELAQLASWIYDDPTDLTARNSAVKRLKTWLYAHPTSHPVALASTLSLLSSLLLVSSSPPTDPHATRLSLSLSLVRFVNSLVDPLQTGQYARPIAMIAAELGIPGWLVELRHAGTHEGLPSVEVLREGAEEALNYLHLAFFLPTLNPKSTSSLLHPQTSDPTSSSSFQGHLSLLPPLLKSYKLLSKSLTKDHSLPSLSLRAVKKDLSGWLDTAERATGSRGDGIRAFVGVLVGGDEELGVLVPVSKKKRSSFTPSTPHPPSHLLSLYSPIIKSLSKAHPTLPTILASSLLSVLISQDPEITPQSDSAAETLSSWLVWTFDDLLGEGGVEREEIVAKAIKGVWENTRAVQLLQVIASRHTEFEARLRPMLSVVDPDFVPMDVTPLSPPSEDLDPTPSSISAADTGLDEMELRLAQLAGLLNPSTTAPTRARSSSPVPTIAVQREIAAAPPKGSGWSLLSVEQWGGGRPMGVSGDLMV